MGNFLVFLDKTNLHWFRDFLQKFPKQQHCFLNLSRLQLHTVIKPNCTYKQPQFTFALSHENINLLWPPLHQLQQTLYRVSTSQNTTQVSLISDLLVSFPLWLNHYQAQKIKTKPLLTHVGIFFPSLSITECSSRHKWNNIHQYIIFVPLKMAIIKAKLVQDSYVHIIHPDLKNCNINELINIISVKEHTIKVYSTMPTLVGIQ